MVEVSAVQDLDTSEFISHLATINYLENCGAPLTQEWAIPKTRDIQSTISSYGTDFGAFKIYFINELANWIRDHVGDDPDEYLFQQRERIEPRIKEIIDLRIWPVLPADIQRADSGTRFQVKSVFKSDLSYMTIEHALVAHGFPPGLFSQMLPPYEAGRYPCGWEGEYPNGKLIVF